MSVLARAGRAFRNATPVSYAPAGGFSLPWRSDRGTEAQMRAMAAVGTLFSIVTRTSNATSQVEWHLWRKTPGRNGERVEVTSHAALDLWNKPNPFFTRQELVESVQQHVELTGEGIAVVARHAKFKALPIELWPVRPDRIAPVPHPTKFIDYWVYTGPNGEEVRLEREDVIQLRMPNPMDPYRGLGAVQSIMVDLGTAQYSAEWNLNFFRNGAQPGGMLKVDRRLSDDEFDEMADRWRASHQGISNAHKVAILENGAEWVESKLTQKDMQFTEMRGVTSQVVREAFGISKFAIGDLDDVNRAAAEAAAAWFGAQLTVPRVERWKQAANNDLLPLYGPTGEDLEFDYESPVPVDQEAERAELASNVAAAVAIIGCGGDPTEALAAFGLPPIPIVINHPAENAPVDPAVTDPGPVAELTAKEQAEIVQKLYLGVDVVVTWDEARQLLHEAGLPVDLSLPDPKAVEPETAAEPADDDPAAEDDDAPAAAAAPMPFEAWIRHQVRNASDPVRDIDTVESIDLSPMQESWETALASLLVLWQKFMAGWRDQLSDQLTAILQSGDLAGLAALTLDTGPAAEALGEKLGAVAGEAADQVVDEAAAQGVRTSPVPLMPWEITANAALIAALDGQRYTQSAAREAMRLHNPAVPAKTTAAAVVEHLESLTDAAPKQALGAALTDAQNGARKATLLAAPEGAIYASEVLDGKTCKYCREIHGRWIANTGDLTPVDKLYPSGGYVNCLGGNRCRGTVVGVWRPKQTGDKK